MPGAGPRTASSLGLPEQVRACLFDLDGVLTETAKVHAAAWKEMFDAFLKARADKGGEPFVAFDEADYDSYVDGKTRADGTRSFLGSRHIELPDGDAGDLAGAPTVSGLGQAKNDIVLRMVRDDGVDAYPGSVRYLRAVVSAGLRRVVVSSSANCAAVLEAAGIADTDVLVALTSSDEVNIVACEIAHALYRTPTKIARVRAPEYTTRAPRRPAGGPRAAHAARAPARYRDACCGDLPQRAACAAGRRYRDRGE